MSLENRMVQLATHIKKLGTIEEELRKYESDIVQSNRGGLHSSESMHSMLEAILDTMSKSGTFFKEQIEVIRKISPPAAEQLDDTLAKYRNVQAKIKREIKKELKKSKIDMWEKQIERLDMYIYELIQHYGEIRMGTLVAYNSIVGTFIFMTSDGTKKAGKGFGIGWKRIR